MNINMKNKKLQIFVSSTYTDLIEERQAAVQAILDAGHIPAGMELFKSGKSQMKTIQKWIDNSDVYMLILGGRYGSIEKESALSYTELEYKYALSKNMPIFTIILSDSFLFRKAADDGKNAVFEQDNIEKYNEFKNIVKEKIVKFVDNIDQILHTISLQIDEIINDEEYNLGGWIKNDLDIIYEELYDSFNMLDNRQIDSLYNKILLLKLIDNDMITSDVVLTANNFIERQTKLFSDQNCTINFYIKNFTRNININLYDEYIEVFTSVQYIFKGNDIKEKEFTFFPWLYPGIEEKTYEFTDIRYNELSNQNYIKKSDFKSAENESYVTGGIGIKIPYNKNANEHIITFNSRYHTDYAKFFHSYTFKRYCENFILSANLIDHRKEIGDKYVLKWEMFTPNVDYSYNSKRKIYQTDTEIRFSPVEWMTPGCGYIITINQIKNN